MKITLTPEKAKELKKLNTHNRPFRKKVSKDYANLIRKGLWDYNGESIKVSITGVLLDGQHRIDAVIETGISIVTEIIYDLPDEIYKSLDQGIVRTVSDVFALNNVKYYTQKSSAISVFANLNLKASLAGKVKDTSREELYSCYILNKDIFDDVMYKNKYVGVSNALIYGIEAYLRQFNRKELVDKFFTVLANGEDCLSTQPKILREFLIKEALNKKSEMVKYEKVAFILKAFSNMKNGLSPKNIRWRNNRSDNVVYPYDSSHIFKIQPNEAYNNGCKA